MIIYPTDHNEVLNLIKSLSDMEIGTYTIEIKKIKNKRTNQQNKALHKYLEMLADALNDAGFEIKKVLLEKPEIEIPWTMETVKNLLWREVQKAVIKKESTTEANKIEYNDVYEVLNRFTSERFGISVPWPCNEK